MYLKAQSEFLVQSTPENERADGRTPLGTFKVSVVELKTGSRVNNDLSSLRARLEAWKPSGKISHKYLKVTLAAVRGAMHFKLKS